MFVASENASGAAPEITAALAEAEAGYAMPYGNDPLTEQTVARVRDVFEAPDAAVYFVATGTAANALSLACLCPPWGTVFCHEGAHIEEDECGSPEFFTGGAKLTLLRGANAKLTEETLAPALAQAGKRGVHSVQGGAVSLTQATELGAAYTVDELRALTTLARKANLPVHMDGTRLANVLARTNASPAEMTWKSGVDVLCLGATKNGAMAAEAVVLFDPERAWEFELRRKRGGHLFSKMRFISSQIDAYLTDDLWLRLAARSNAMADRLAAGIAASPDAHLTNSIGANMLFPEVSMAQHRRLQAAGARYYPWGAVDDNAPDDARVTIRLVASFRTTEADVDGFLDVLNG
ncbi:MAG: beta-eliminating lyase-related protein [Pseudomonadota bacterium]